MAAPTWATPIVGVNAVVELGLPASDGGPATTFIKIKNSNYEIKPTGNVKEAPNTSDGMLRAPGLHDYTLTFKGHTDVSGGTAATPPAVTPTPNAPEMNVMPNTILDFKAYRSYTADNATGGFWAGRIIVMDLGITTGTDQTEGWDCSAAKQAGALTKPDGTTW